MPPMREEEEDEDEEEEDEEEEAEAGGEGDEEKELGAVEIAATGPIGCDDAATGARCCVASAASLCCSPEATAEAEAAVLLRAARRLARRSSICRVCSRRLSTESLLVRPAFIRARVSPRATSPAVLKGAVVEM